MRLQAGGNQLWPNRVLHLHADRPWLKRTPLDLRKAG